MFSILNPRGEESDMISADLFVEQCENIRTMHKNKSRLNTLNKNSVFSMTSDNDPLHKLKLENTKLNERINQCNTTIDINLNKIHDFETQAKKLENIGKEKSDRITNLQEECENLRLNMKK